MARDEMEDAIQERKMEPAEQNIEDENFMRAFCVGHGTTRNGLRVYSFLDDGEAEEGRMFMATNLQKKEYPQKRKPYCQWEQWKKGRPKLIKKGSAKEGY
ncbi:hypothetical protein PTKIN_Ptkin03bG0115900 [Pterospermum kingtungense]